MELNSELQAKLEKLSKLPEGARAGLLVGLGVLLCVGYYFGAYQDRSLELKEMRAKELELQRKLSSVRSVAANIGEFEEEITQLEARLHEALRQLPNRKELDALLTDISNLGKTAGIEMKSFRRQDEVIHDFYAEVPIAIELEGEYHDIARFFDLMAKLPRIVNMGAISMSVASESINSTRLHVSGRATTFRFADGDAGA